MGPGHGVKAAIANARNAGNIRLLQRVRLQHNHCGRVRKADRQQAAVRCESHAEWLAPAGWPHVLHGRQALLAQVVQAHPAVHAGGGQPPAVWGKARAVDLAFILCVAVELAAAAPADCGSKQPHALAPQANHQHLAVGGKGQLGDCVGQACDALDHGACGALKQVDIVVGRPATHGHDIAVRRNGGGKQPADVVRADRRAKGLQQSPAGQLPDAGGLVVRGRDGVAACGVNCHCPDGGAVGPRVDPQHRCFCWLRVGRLRIGRLCIDRLRMACQRNQGACRQCKRRQAG